MSSRKSAKIRECVLCSVHPHTTHPSSHSEQSTTRDNGKHQRTAAATGKTTPKSPEKAMVPRGTPNRKRSSTSTAGKSTKANAPALTLHEILETLGISFNNKLGILSGDATGVVPQVATVESLRKLLLKLNDQLEIVSNNDDTIIDEVRAILTAREKGELIDSEDDSELEESAVDGRAAPTTDTEAMAADGDAETKVKKEVKDNEPLPPQRDTDGDVEMADNVDPLQQGDSKKHGAVKEDEDEEDDDDDDKDVFTDANDTLLKPHEPKEPSERRMSVDRIENDPSVRNPKSEFVTSQTLPAAAQALGLFSEEDGGLNQTGEEYFKKKYAVSSYPKTDLQDKLPGVIPDIDFSKSKPTNQVQFQTFQTWFDNFYRAFTEDDLKFLKSKTIMTDTLASDSTYDPNLTPYLIPDLGQLYSDVWNEEENAGNYSPPPQRITKDAVTAKRSASDLNDDNLETENVSCGPLVSRLLSAILKDDKDDVHLANGGGNITDSNATADNDDDGRSITSATALPEQQGWKVSSVNADYSTLEDRLKRELKYIGIFMNLSGDNSKDDDGDDDAEPDWLNPQDDEVSTELRMLQNELKQASKRNNKRKKILLPIIEKQLAWQEYNSILDDLEKQVDQSYLKRIRVPKNKKKKTTGNSVPPSMQIQQNAHAAQQAAANSAVKSLLEKRQKWIEKIGPLFDRDGTGPESTKKYPKESVFDKENLDEDEDDDYEDGEDLVLQQQDHQ